MTTSPGDTRRIGQRLGALLRAGDVILLSGELGAGKTVFVQGIARGLGYDGSVSSKSFVLLGEYACSQHSRGGGLLKLYHADLYRLEEPEQVQELALAEISAEGVLVVEWPERAPHVLPEEHLQVCFAVTGEETRSLCFAATGKRAVEIIRALNR